MMQNRSGRTLVPRRQMRCCQHASPESQSRTLPFESRPTGALPHRFLPCLWIILAAVPGPCLQDALSCLFYPKVCLFCCAVPPVPALLLTQSLFLQWCFAGRSLATRYQSQCCSFATARASPESFLGACRFLHWLMRPVRPLMRSAQDRPLCCLSFAQFWLSCAYYFEWNFGCLQSPSLCCLRQATLFASVISCWPGLATWLHDHLFL